MTATCHFINLISFFLCSLQKRQSLKICDVDVILIITKEEILLASVTSSALVCIWMVRIQTQLQSLQKSPSSIVSKFSSTWFLWFTLNVSNFIIRLSMCGCFRVFVQRAFIHCLLSVLPFPSHFPLLFLPSHLIIRSPLLFLSSQCS